MTKPTMPTKQQLSIAQTLNADLSRIGAPAAQPAAVEIERRKRDTNAFVLPISWIVPDPDQVRQIGKTKDDQQVQELARSMAEHGQMTPIEVRELIRDKQYMIVAGEGRYVAAKDILGWTEIRVTLADATDEQIVWRQLHENIHRRGLHPLDLARAIDQAMNDGLTMEQVADKLGKSLTWVQKARTVATDLTEEARQELLKSPRAESVDMAYEVATTRPEEQANIARKITQEDLTRDQVRELTRTAKRDGESHHSGRTGRKAKKKPFSLRWVHETGVIFHITARKKSVSDEELLDAAQAFVRKLTGPKKKREAA